MKKLNLAEWAAIAEIFGAVAVVISLLFVAQSVNSNTVALQANNDNLMYQLQDSSSESISTNSELASIIVKFRNGDRLTDVEDLQFEQYVNRRMNRWELGFNRFNDGLLAPELFAVWDKAYSTSFLTDFRREWWPDWRPIYSEEFALHIDSILEHTK